MEGERTEERQEEGRRRGLDVMLWRVTLRGRGNDGSKARKREERREINMLGKVIQHFINTTQREIHNILLLFFFKSQINTEHDG